MKKILCIFLSLILLVGFASCGGESSGARMAEPTFDEMAALISELADTWHSRQEIKDAMIEAGTSTENAENYISNFGYSWEAIAAAIINDAYINGQVKDKDEAKALLAERKFTQEEINYAVDRNNSIPTREARERQEKLSIALQEGPNEDQKPESITRPEPTNIPEQKPVSKPEQKIDYASFVVGTWEGYLEHIGVETGNDGLLRDNAEVTITFKDGICTLAGFARGFSYDYDVFGSGTYSINGNELSYSLSLNYSNYDEGRFSKAPEIKTRTLIIDADKKTIGSSTLAQLTKKSDDVVVLEASTLTKTH